MQSKHQQKVNDRLAQNLKAGKENVKNALPGLKKTRKALNLFENQFMTSNNISIFLLMYLLNTNQCKIKIYKGEK